MSQPSFVRSPRRSRYLWATVGLALLASGAARAATVKITVTMDSLVPSSSVAFAPLRLGFNNGTFDAFNLGSVASTAIRTVAESGSGADWFPAFALADPGAVTGTVGSAPLLPGQSANASFIVNTDDNPYFSFAAMVVPSNDFFVGNDSPTAYRLFDAAGNLQISHIDLGATNIWDAGTEVWDPASAAFLAIGNAALHTDQNSVVARNFAELAAFNGLLTAGGYNFDSQLTAGSSIARISFDVAPVPVPASLPLLFSALGSLGMLMRRRVQTDEGQRG